MSKEEVLDNITRIEKSTNVVLEVISTNNSNNKLLISEMGVIKSLAQRIRDFILNGRENE